VVKQDNDSYLYGYKVVDIAADVALDFVLGQSGHPRYKGPRYTQYKLGGLVRNPYETLF
jgi:hypothetical protein